MVGWVGLWSVRLGQAFCGLERLHCLYLYTVFAGACDGIDGGQYGTYWRGTLTDSYSTIPGVRMGGTLSAIHLAAVTPHFLRFLHNCNENNKVETKDDAVPNLPILGKGRA